MNFDYIEFRADIKAELSRKKLTYKDITPDNLRLKTVQGFMSERKTRKPSITVAKEIAKKLGINFDSYITESEQQE